MEQEIELWKPIEGHEKYEISSLGRVRRLKPSGEKIIKLKLKHSRKKNVNRHNMGYLVLPLRLDEQKI